jgi:uncharacterized protein YbjT (DUF2867 family)
MYKIIGADQKEYGPVTAEQVRQWVREGRANMGTIARFEEGPWKPLSTFPDNFSSAAAVVVFGRRFDIAGDELTGEEAAAILSKVTGREVHYEGFPPDVLRAQSEDVALMFEWFDSTGYAADIHSLRRDFPEVTWHSFEEWARKQDWSAEAVGAPAVRRSTIPAVDDS